MANVITRNIPNTITSCNLFCGCIASYMAFHSKYEVARLFIGMGATLGFFYWMVLATFSTRLSPVCCVFRLSSEKNLTLWQTTSRSDLHRLPLLFPCLKRYITRIFYSRCQESCLIRLS